MSLLDPPQRIAPIEPAPAWDEIRAVAGRMEPLSLPELERLALMDRIDTKFVFDVAELGGLLAELGPDYRVLAIDGHVLHRYANQYFDTVDLDCYRHHHNADLPRYKFRYRDYLHTGQVFFEIKQKTNQGRTVKHRVPVDESSLRLVDPAVDLIERVAGDRGWDADALVPSVHASFSRLAVANLHDGERATIDVGLRVDLEGEHSAFDSVAICELKQTSFSRTSPLAQALKRRGVRPHRMTKYCLGVLSARADVKANEFKAMVRTIVGVGTVAP